MQEPSDRDRELSRARTLMEVKGYGWSKAIAVAAETVSGGPARDRAGRGTRQQLPMGNSEGSDERL